MKVSIITVSYNSRETIEKTIRSVLNQTYADIEYIIIDGLSTDGTQEIISKNRASIATFISEPDEGLYDAMNKGISYATGDVIGIINSDDWYELDAVEKVIKCFEKTDADVVYGKMKVWENGKCRMGKKVLPEEIWHTMIPHPTVFIKKNVYDRYGCFDLKYKIAADYDLVLRLWTSGVKVHYIDEVISNFRKGGISNANPENLIEAANEAYSVSLKYYKMYHGEENIAYKINQNYAYGIFTANIRDTKKLEKLICSQFDDMGIGLVIFGAGTWGERFCHELKKTSIKLDFVVDNDERQWGTQLEGIEIRSPDVLRSAEANVLIAIKDCDKEVEEQLRSFHNGKLEWMALDKLVFSQLNLGEAKLPLDC